MIRFPHRTIIGLIKLMPLPAGRFMFRVYDKALRTIRPEYRARTYFGARLVCNTRDLIQRTILYFGVWEPDISSVIESSLSPGDVFVDVGANIGYDTLLASRLVGGTGAVVAIEASARTFALLTRNLALNEAGNVRAVNLAVSDRETTLDLYEVNDRNIGAATTLASRGGTPLQSVDARPLETILSPDELARVRLIKMDIEGAEPPVLRRLLDTLPLYPATMDVLVEATPTGDGVWADLFERMARAGFCAYGIENSYELEWYLTWRKPAPLRKLDAAPAVQQDILFTRRSIEGH